MNISSRQLMNIADAAGYDQTQSATSPFLINDEQLNSFSAEQFFLYQATGITLKKGERSSLRLFSLTVPCSEVFEWTVNDDPEWYAVDGGAGDSVSRLQAYRLGYALFYTGGRRQRSSGHTRGLWGEI